MRKGFTLLEMLISVGLLSIIVIFLYQTNASLQHSNTFYGGELSAAWHEQKLRKTIYLDLALSMPESFQTVNLDKDTDIILMQSSHSVHRRIMPYIGYMLRDGHLWRIEASEPLVYPLRGDEEMVVDDLGTMRRFRVYPKGNAFLVNMEKPDKKMILFRTNRLNEVVEF